MTPAILDEPIRGVLQQRRKSLSHALHARTWFRIVGTLASGKKLTLRRRSNTAIRTWRYTLALALTTSPKPTSGG